MAEQHTARQPHDDPPVGDHRAAWGRTVIRFRWPVLLAALALVVLGVSWGSGVFGALSSGGFDDPGSESVRASERIATEIGRRDADLVVLYSSSTATADEAPFRDPVVTTTTALRKRPEVASVLTFYDTAAPGLVSADRQATYAVVTLRAADDDGKLDQYRALRPALTAPGITTQVGGVVAVQAAADDQVASDLARGEKIAMPLVLLLLVLIFGGLVAATVPLLIGVLAVLGGLTVTRLLTTVTDVSTFAVNTILLLGLGMAIDYSLLILTRFREELRAGRDPRTAVVRTMSTAGRTVLVSGLTIVLALSSLLIFPQVFLRSLGMGATAAVLVATVGALTVLPALLSILGPRIDAWRLPLPRRRMSATRSTAPGSSHGAWATLARSVMRRPARHVAGVVLVLAVLASPFLRAEFSGADERVLPPDTQARVVAERIAADFPGGSVAPIDVFVHGATASQVADLAARVHALPGVTGAEVSARRGEATLLSVGYVGERTGERAHAAVRAIRNLPTPAGVEVLVGGRTAADIDRLAGLGDRLPWMAAIMAAATLILLFLAFGSVLLPVQAVLMNLVSIGASFGVVVWIFQDGHLAGWLGFTPTGFLEPTIPILIFAVLFGLSTDYEVFLLSRIREAWDATGDNTTSIAVGLQRTGRIITSAALLLVVVVAGFAAGDVVFAKMIGIGMITAIVVDATLVRAVLVPASMRLIGRWNWWAPGPLTRLYRRHGIREADGTTPDTAPPPTALAGAGTGRSPRGEAGA